MNKSLTEKEKIPASVSEEIKGNDKRPTYTVVTFGCQMNERDSETLAGMLCELGYIEEEDKMQADVVILNTCSVRENADKRFFGILGQLKAVKELYPSRIVAVCGCMMQQQHVIDTLKSKYPWVDLIFGTHNIHEFPKLFTNVATMRQKIVAVQEEAGEIREGLPTKRLYPFKAFINIMYGCNNFCTYCIVPYTRGRERSRKPSEILAEAEALVKDGVKEITLLGQNVNSYENDFSGLICSINQIEGLSRIRFMTSHPKDCSERLIEAFAKCEKLCPHIHLPVQAGSNRILKAMNRKYTREDYLLLIEKLRSRVPHIAITTDIIVGFPGETEEDFAETLDLVRIVEFDSAFTFLYSVRQGTPAAKMENQVPESVKHERFNRLVELVNESAAKKNKACVGKVENVLVEGVSKTSTQNLTGRTDSFKLVNFPGDESLSGQLVKVKITQGKTFNLTGELV